MGRLLDEDDVVSRQAVYTVIEEVLYETTKGADNWYGLLNDGVRTLPSAQPQNADCIYCHEDSDGCVVPLEKNCHAFIRFGMDGWELSLKAKGWHGNAKIRYCPMCGRELKT